jgi:hypothetical protein
MKTSLHCALGALALLCSIAACGGGEEKPPTVPPPPTQETAKLSLSPGAQSLTAGAPAVTFTAAGGTGTYTWALAPASGVGTLSATQGASVTFTPASSMAESSAATLTVTSGAESASVVLTVEPRAIDGRVLTMRDLAPFPGLSVSLRNADGTFTTATTDAEGRFRFPSVPASYELVVHETEGDVYSVYRGLTRVDPVLKALGGSGPAGYVGPSATLAGTVSGAIPAPGGSYAAIDVNFASPGLGLWSFPSQEFVTNDSTSGEYLLNSRNLAWTGADSITGTVHALQIQRAAGVPTSYGGYGKRENVTVRNGDELTGQDIVLAPVEETSFSVSFDLPTGAVIDRQYVQLQYGPHSSTDLIAQDNTNAPISLPTPKIPGASLAVRAHYYATHGYGAHVRVGVPVDATGLVLKLADVPAFEAPAEGATGVTYATTFSWAAVPDATHVVEFVPETTGPRFFVATTGTQTTLPDLSGLGASLPGGAAYAWRMLTFAPVASVDAFAVPGGGEPLFFTAMATGAPVESSQFGTGERSFTTAP